MACLLLNNTCQNSGQALIVGLRVHKSQLIRNLLNSPQQYNKCQTRAEEIKMCLDERLE